jgi:hypothetical protein
MNMAIINQCPNVELTSPIYFTNDAMHYIKFPQQVNSKSIMKASFITGIDRSTFGGILLYRLQRREDASTCIRLLVIWGCNSYRIYLHVLLIEHESAIVWDKDKLKMLYNEYDSQDDIDLNTREWLLNDNTKLKTDCEASYVGLEVETTISEEKNLQNFIVPLWIDFNR